MTKHKKAAARFTSQPTPSDITWQELKAFLEGKGYKELKNDGSRRKFFNSTINDVIILHKPHPGNIVKKVYIKQIIIQLDAKGLIDKQ